MKYKYTFQDLFTVMAWLTCLAYIVYCTVYDKKAEGSIGNAWNILILIAGYVWGKSSKEKSETPSTVKADTVNADNVETVNTNTTNVS